MSKKTICKLSNITIFSIILIFIIIIYIALISLLKKEKFENEKNDYGFIITRHVTPTEKKNETKNILLNTFSVMQMYLKRLDST